MKIEQEFIAITLDDGSLAIMGFVTKGRGSLLPHGAKWDDEAGGWWTREATDENIFEEIGRTGFGGKQATNYRKIDRAEIPQDRTYRDAMIDKDGRLDFDMPKAREIHKNILRRMCEPMFVQNDLDLRDALAENDNQKQRDALKKRDDLRAVTDDPAIEAAQTIEELKAVVPAVLTEA